MWPYLAVFAGAVLIDIVPVFAPPAWILIAVMAVKFDLNVWAAAAVGALGATIGRYLLSLFMPRVMTVLFKPKANDNIAYLGRRLGGSGWSSFLFVLAYSHTPLSSTTLFTAAGVARVNPLPILPAFFIGKFVCDAVMVFGSKGAAQSIRQILKGQGDPKAIAFAALGVLLIGALLFVDWRALLERRTLRLDFRVWNGSREHRRERRRRRGVRWRRALARRGLLWRRRRGREPRRSARGLT